MRRELKVLAIRSACSRSIEGHKAYPDEKGTERDSRLCILESRLCHKAYPDEKGTERA